MTSRRFVLLHAPGAAGGALFGTRRALLAAASAILALTGLLVATRGVEGAGAATSLSPYGKVEVFSPTAGGMYTRGWAIDPSWSARSLSVYTTIDGRRAATAAANRSRPDIASAHRGAGAAHGFMFSTRVAQGRHTVCVWAKNIYSGRDTRLSCRTRTLNYGPRGAIEYVRTAHGGLSIKGWAADGDSPHTPLSVVVTVDKTQTVLPANSTDSTVPSWAGSAHGYSAFLATSQGSHKVCVLAKNIGYGSDSTPRLPHDHPRRGADRRPDHHRPARRRAAGAGLGLRRRQPHERAARHGDDRRDEQRPDRERPPHRRRRGPQERRAEPRLRPVPAAGRGVAPGARRRAQHRPRPRPGARRPRGDAELHPVGLARRRSP